MDLIINGLYDHFKNNRLDLIKNIFFVTLIPFANIKLSQSIGKLLSAQNIDLGLPVVMLVIIIISIQILHSLNDLNNIKQSSKVAGKFNERVLKNTLYRDLPKNNAEIKVGRDMFNIDVLWSFNKKFFVSLKDDLIQFIVFYMFAIYVFFNIDRNLGYALLGFAIVTFFIIKKSIEKCKDSGSERDRYIAKFKSAIDDTLNNVKFIKLNNKEEESYNKIMDEAKNISEHLLDNVHCRVRYSNYLNIFFVLFVILIIYIVNKEKNNGSIDKGNIIVIFFILSNLISYRVRLTKFQAILSENNGTINRLRWSLEDYEKKKKVKEIVKIKEIENIKFDKVKLTKKQKVSIDFNAIPGEIVCIVGSNSLDLYKITSLLTGTNRPKEGKITINNQEYKPDQLFEITGVLLQDPELFNKTINENLFLETIFDEKVLELRLKEANLYNEYKKLIKKYPNKIGRKGTRIPMESRRLIEFMRIVVKNPELIILDNPFEFFDENMKNKIKNLIFRWKNENKIVFILEKNFYNFTSCDYVINISRYNL